MPSAGSSLRGAHLASPCNTCRRPSRRELRDAIHAQVRSRGFDATRACFVQSYDTTDLDASLLLIPAVGFLPPDDPRVHATVDAIQRELMSDGLVLRYPTGHGVDGLAPGEGAFLSMPPEASS